MDNQSGSECPRRRRLRYTASLFYFIYGCCFEREEIRFFFEFRRRVNALAKREGKKTKNEEKCEELFVPGGPMIVLTHSYKLSPFGPALQFVGGSKLISASSFWMRFAAELIPDLLIFSLSFSTTNFMKSLSLSLLLSLCFSLSLLVDVCVSPFNFFELNTLLLAIRFLCSRSSLFYYTVSARTSPFFCCKKR